MASQRIYGPAQLANSNTLLYTAAAGQTVVVRHVHVSNPTGAAVTFSLAILTGATAANRLFDAYSIAAGAVLDWFCYLPLAGGTDTLYGFASAATSLVCSIAADVNVTG